MIGFRKVWGGFEGAWACFGGSRWVKGGLLDPYRALFAPLEVLYGTKFGSNHHIMVQVSLTQFRTFGAPLGAIS